MSNVVKPIVEPTLIETLQALKSDVFKNLYCHIPGRIQSFDGTKKTAVIQLLFATTLPDETTVTYPVLADCPVFTPQGGGGAFQAPIAAGDPCLVVFADRNLDAWFQNGSVAVPFDQVGGQPGRAHDLSDGLAFVGFNSLADALTSYSTDELRMIMGTTKVAISKSTGLVTIANQSTTLLQLLQSLIMVLQGATIDTTHGVFTAPTIAQLGAIDTMLQELLY
jgi:Phage protein Gp138 N-terminal domain